MMQKISMLGGLHRMSGVCSKHSSFEELGVGEEGHDWDGTYGE